MPDPLVATVPPAPFEDAAEMRRANAGLLEAIDRRLGHDSRPESEVAVLGELESRIRAFLDRGAATGTLVEDIKERTACQVLLDYWSSTLSHAGLRVPRSRLAPFDADRLPVLDDNKRPYVGLESFRNSDFFFGRERAVAGLLRRLSEVQLVVVQGGSGSGKSSLVMGGALPVLGAAGHVPRFRVVGPFTPGNAVLENLVGALAASSPDAHLDRVAEAEALRASPARLPEILGGAATTPDLLVVDQFEEVFTLCNDRDRAAIAAAIDALLRSCSACRVILTLREEFANELDKLEPLRPYFAQHARFSMKEWPMGYDELRAAVERPAALVNLHFAPGIVDELVKSVLGQDTALPLLQFTLQSLWKQRDHNRVTREVYEKVGSPLVALKRYADGFYNGLSPENQEEVERILLELVRIDRMMEAYREPRMRSILLATGNPHTPEMLELLAREDFLRITPTVDDDATVEVKHEALLRNWPRYVEWIGGKREGVRQRVALTEASQRWDERGRNRTKGLLSPWQLDDVQHLTGLNQLEQDYVQASIEHADADRRAREREQRLKYFVAAVGFTSFVVLIGSLFWVVSAQTARDRIDVQAQFARAREASYRGQIDRAVTGALAAGIKMSGLPDGVRVDLRPQLREVLLSTLQNAINLKQLFLTKDGTFNAVAFHPTRSDTLIAFGGSNGRTYVASLAGVGKPFAKSLEACDAQGVSALAFDPQGRLLVVGCVSGALSVYSADDWHWIGGQQVSHNFIRSLSIRPDGRLIAASGGDHVALVQLDEKGDPSRQPVSLTEGEAARAHVQTVAFSPAGDTLLAGDGQGYVLVCQPGSEKSWGCKGLTGYVPPKNDAILKIAYSPDGGQIAIGHYWRGVVEIWDSQLSSNSQRAVYHQSPSAVYSLAFFEGCGRRQLAIGTDTGLEYSPIDASLQTAEPVEFCAKARWAQIGDQTYSVAFDSRHGLLAAATQSGYVAVLDPSGEQDPLRGGRDPLRTRQDPMRTRMPPMAESKPIRGALVAGARSTAWLALTTTPTEADARNVALLRLREGRADGDILRFAAGRGEIQRLSASTQTHRLAAIGCTRLAGEPECSQKDPYEVSVWQFTDPPQTPAQIVSLASPDFKGRAPHRVVVSPDGQWIVVSFQAPPKGERTREPLLVLGLNSRSKGNWLDSNLESIQEIAFSNDSSMFAAGGCCAATGTDVNQIRLWSVSPSGFKPRGSPLTLTPLARSVQELAFASDKKGRSLLLAGGRFGTIDRWDLDTEKRDELRIGTHAVSFISFTQGESLIAAADSQGVVRLLDMSNWPPFQLTPPADDAAQPGFLAFTEDGALLAASADKVDLWNIDLGSVHRKVCALLREVKPDGVSSDMPLWHGDRECKEGALTPSPRSYLERAREFLMRVMAALRFRSS